MKIVGIAREQVATTFCSSQLAYFTRCWLPSIRIDRCVVKRYNEMRAGVEPRSGRKIGQLVLKPAKGQVRQIDKVGSICSGEIPFIQYEPPRAVFRVVHVGYRQVCKPALECSSYCNHTTLQCFGEDSVR